MERPPTRLQFGPVTLDPGERVLLKDGQPIALTPKAFDLLVFLAENPARLLTKDEILRAVWPDAVVEESNLAYHIFAIRKGLGDGADTDRYIETVPKRGYRFIAPVVRLGEAHAAAAEEGQTVPAGGPGAGAEQVVATSAEGAEGAASLRRPSFWGAPWIAWIIGLTGLVIGAGAVGFFGLRPSSAVDHPSLVRFQEPLWGRPAEPTMFLISPDSRHLMLAIQGIDGVARLWVRTLSESVPRPLPQSEGFIMPPAIWSPRSDAVAFANAGALKRVTLSGGVPQTVCDVSGLAVGGSWNRDDVILVGNPTGPLLRCPASGGNATPVTQTSDPPEIHLMSAGHRTTHGSPVRIRRRSRQRPGRLRGARPLSEPAKGCSAYVIERLLSGRVLPSQPGH